MSGRTFKPLSSGICRRFRRLPAICRLVVLLLFLVYIYMLCQLLLPFPYPLVNEVIQTFGGEQKASEETLVLDHNLTEPVYRHRIRGNFEPDLLTLPSPANRPGDFGYAVKEPSSSETEYGMNMAVSDRIPMDRVVPDLRYFECKYWHYPEVALPTASVVIAFHNEGLTTLMRTVHSVLLRSPQRFLREVLLVDDYSDKTLLKAALEQYIEQHFGEFKLEFGSTGSLQGESIKMRSGKVRLVRNRQRSGLIRTRAYGASQALGEVVVFLDAHCEVNYNWLVPLLVPIAANNRTMTVPIVDGIDAHTFQYRAVYQSDSHFMGIWEWGMLYKETAIDLTAHMRYHLFSEPYESPTHAGGLLAIHKRYFEELGGYDQGLLLWGGENFELSFKVWQCGGRLLWVPCSRVGHVYRSHMPYSAGSLAIARKGPLALTNYRRVVEVWMEQPYKQYFYTREPLAGQYDSGDISTQLALKSKLQCKSFHWFMQNHAQAVLKDFPGLPANVAWGELRSAHFDKRMCLDSAGAHPPSVVGLYSCHGTGGNQLFRLNGKGQLGLGERCIDSDGNGLRVYVCQLGTVHGPWTYQADSKLMLYRSHLCLAVKSKREVHLVSCEAQPTTEQQWTWHNITL